MVIKSIKRIKNYKSFIEFEWERFFNKNVSDTRYFAYKQNRKANIIYGENGSGKSSICEIIKNIVGDYEFPEDHSPEMIEIDFDKVTRTYSKDKGWSIADEDLKPNKKPDNDSKEEKKEILVFDREFVRKNVHVANIRSGGKGEPGQNSSELLIMFDENAIKLEKEMETKKNDIKDLEKQYADVKNFTLSDDEQRVYEKVKEKAEEELKTIKHAYGKYKNNAENKLKEQNKNLSNISELHKNLIEIPFVKKSVIISNLSKYEDLFCFDLKTIAKDTADKELVKLITDHSEFFKTGIKIREEHKTKCPFCQSEHVESNVKKVIDAYNAIYDEEYNKQLKNFVVKRQELNNELSLIREQLEKFDIQNTFDILNDYDRSYDIANLYKSEEKNQYRKPVLTELKKMEEVIEKLDKPDNRDISTEYQELKREVKKVKSYWSEVETFIEGKNRLIENFKKENTDENLSNQIKRNKKSLECYNTVISLLSDNRIGKQKRKEEYDEKKNVLDDEHSKAKEKFETYCKDGCFENALERMMCYLKEFDVNFTLELDDISLGTRIKKPFIFNIVDPSGETRKLEKGLSEGELQVLSLCFFFSYLDVQENKEEKILVFDDPITSFDNNNLSFLVDLILTEHWKYAQTFIFTHHQTFFKFLRKTFTNNKAEFFNVLKTSKDLGGSFLCSHSKVNPMEMLADFDKHLVENATSSPTDLQYEIVKYGQYLRYAIESFIKNDLLMMDRGRNFGNLISDAKKNMENLDYDSIEKIKKIYTFCNMTTAHATDAEDDNGSRQLKKKIGNFIEIYGKVIPADSEKKK